MTKLFRCDNISSLIQMLGSCALLTSLYVGLLLSLSWQLPLALTFSIAIGITNVRIFNLMHDCAHYAYFTSRKANVIAGVFLGLLTLIPFHYWKRHHLRHHGTSGNLDRRGHGDIWMLTVDEYHAKRASVKLLYRLYRNPFFFLALGPALYFGVKMRFPFQGTRGAKEWLGVLIVNIFWVGAYAAGSAAGYSIAQFLFLHGTSLMIGGSIGLWLFFVQHQFEHTSWKREQEWQFRQCSYDGSSFLQLPMFLEWLFVRINLHHVHHADPKVPNYLLRHAAGAIRANEKRPLAMGDAVLAFQWKLWDERKGRMAKF